MSWYQTASQEDAPKSGASLPATMPISFKGGKIQANMVQRVAKDLSSMVGAGEVGFSYWNSEDSRAVAVKKFEMVILGSFWRVDTFTGNGVAKVTSSSVLDIKRDVMTLYRDGEKTASGLYNDLKESFPSKETRAYRYVLLYSPATGKLATVKLNSTVDNALRRAFFSLENPGKPAQPKANLWDIDGNDRRFFVLLYSGQLEMLDVDGKDHTGKGEGYIAPKFTVAKVTPENADVFGQCVAAKASYIGVLQERLAGKGGAQKAAEEPDPKKAHAKRMQAAKESLDAFGFGATIEEPEQEIVIEDDNDLPF